MEGNLVLATNQTIKNKPFIFNSTGLTVYTLEEAAFNCYKNWELAIYDFNTDEFINWIENDLEQPLILSNTLTISQNYTAFLKFSNLFSNEKINILQKKLFQWENRQEWERLKESGDISLSNKRYINSIWFYSKAINFVENEKIYNNLGICYKYIGNYQESVKYLKKAYCLNCSEIIIIIGFIESLILMKNFDEAEKLLTKHKSVLKEDVFDYFRGKIFYFNEDYKNALANFDRCCKASTKCEYIFSYVDCAMKMRQFEEAEKYILKYDDPRLIFKKAEVFYNAGNANKAIKFLESNMHNSTDINIYIQLAKYYRLIYNLKMAKKYINIALLMDKKNYLAKLESGFILKNEGKIKDYNCTIIEILDEMKLRYRKND